MIVYKYKSLGDSSCALEQEKQINYLRDIIKNNRLYAADFNILDDPMEGVFESENVRSDEVIQNILKNKNNLYICSLSPTYQSMLMWSFYANYHKGCCIEVEIADDILCEVEYHDNPINIDNGDYVQLNTSEKTKIILSRKFKDWGFENELRILCNEHHVNVIVKKVYFGMRVDDALYDKLKDEIEQENHEIEVLKMKDTMFEHIDTTDRHNR